MRVINIVFVNCGLSLMGTSTMYLCGEKSPCVPWSDHFDIDFYPCIDTPDNTISLLCVRS